MPFDSAETDALFVELWNAGVQIKDIAPRVGCAKSYVPKRAAILGLAPRTRLEVTDEMILALIDAGKTCTEVCAEVKRSQRTVREVAVSYKRKFAGTTTWTEDLNKKLIAAAAEGLTDKAIGQRLGVTTFAAGNQRRRLVRQSRRVVRSDADILALIDEGLTQTAIVAQIGATSERIQAIAARHGRVVVTLKPVWTDALIAQLREDWAAGVTGSTIAQRLGFTKSAVAGKLFRLGLSHRSSIRANGPRPSTTLEQDAAIVALAATGLMKKQIAAITGTTANVLDRILPAGPVEQPRRIVMPVVFGAARGCQFPLWGHGERPQFRADGEPDVCGRATVPGTSWCGGCRAIVYTRREAA